MSSTLKSSRDSLDREMEDCRAFEKWSHHLLVQNYQESDIDHSSHLDDYLLMYIMKARKLEESYKSYHVPALESREGNDSALVKVLAEEMEHEEQEGSFFDQANLVAAGDILSRGDTPHLKRGYGSTDTTDTISGIVTGVDLLHTDDRSEQEKERQESIQHKIELLSFPFNQVSHGVFLAYIMEILAGVKKHTYVSRLKTDITYQIQVLLNLFSLNSQAFSIQLTVPSSSYETDDVQYPNPTGHSFQRLQLRSGSPWHHSRK